MRSVLKKSIVFLLVFTMVITLGVGAYTDNIDLEHDLTKIAVEGEEPLEVEDPVEDEEAIKDEEAIEDEEPIEDEDPIEDEEPVKDEEAIEDEEPIEDEDPIEGEEAVKDEEPVEGEKLVDSLLPPVDPIPETLSYIVKYFVDEIEEFEWEVNYEITTDNPIILEVTHDNMPEGYIIDEENSTVLPFEVSEENNVIKVYYIPSTPNVLEYTIYYFFTTLDDEDIKGEMKGEVSPADPLVTVDNLPEPEDLPMGYVIDEENSTLPYEVTEEDNEIVVYYVIGMLRSLMGGNIQALNYFPASGTSTNGHYSAIGVYITPNGDVHILINELSGGNQYRFINGTINANPFLNQLDGNQNINQKTNPLPLSNSETIILPDNQAVSVSGTIRIWDFNIGPMISSLAATNNLYIKNQADGYTISITSLGINLSHEITKDVKIANDEDYGDSVIATIGDELIYRVIVKNTGDLSLSGINVYDDVPAGITILGVSENELPWDDLAWGAVSTSSGNVILKTNLTLAVNESKTYYIKAIVNEYAIDGQTIINTAFTGGSVPRKEDTAKVDIEAIKIDVTIKKFITGNLADLSKSFSFIVVVEGDEENPINFSLFDGESHVINDLPAGSILTLRENAEGYDITVMIGSTVISPNQDGSYTITLEDENITITVTNNKDVTIDTGIALDSLPYILILAIASIFLVMKFVRKRNVYN